jgi:SGNH domain (fused to AT3 domains)
VFAEWAVAGRGQAVASARAILQRFHERGARVVLEGPLPIFKAPTFRCVECYNRTIDLCSQGLKISRADLEAYREPILAAMTRLSNEVPGVAVWDPFPILCPPGDLCSAIADGHPLFFDADHLSGHGTDCSRNHSAPLSPQVKPSFPAKQYFHLRNDARARSDIWFRSQSLVHARWRSLSV